MNPKRTHVLPAKAKISRVDYSKHPHARIISIAVGIAGLLALYVWGFNAV